MSDWVVDYKRLTYLAAHAVSVENYIAIYQDSGENDWEGFYKGDLEDVIKEAVKYTVDVIDEAIEHAAFDEN